MKPSYKWNLVKMAIGLALLVPFAHFGFEYFEGNTPASMIVAFIYGATGCVLIDLIKRYL